VNFDFHARRRQTELRAARDTCDTHDHSLVAKANILVGGINPDQLISGGQLSRAGLARPGFEFSDPLFQSFETRAGAFEHLPLRIEFVPAGEIELAEVGAQYGAEVLLEVLPQAAGTGCEPGRQSLHQAA
jgi:hypothetical protein